MNQLQAFRDTLAFIEKHGRMERWEENSRGRHTSIRPDHVEDMLLRVEADPGAFSPSKLGRWLGWAQCAATACGVLSLDEAKTINKANSKDEGLECGTGDWMQTFTGKKFYPYNPQIDDICIEDIAHHLAMLTRYGGACHEFYSIAEHSIHISYQVGKEDALWALLHDSPEFAIGDMIRPVKHDPRMKPFRETEDKIMLKICEKFGLPPGMPASVKRADGQICLTEGLLLLPNQPEPWNIPGPPLAVDIQCWSPRVAERKFLERFEELTQGPKPPDIHRRRNLG